MSSYQHISEDKIRQIITVEENEALQKYEKVRKGINKLSDSVAELKKNQEALRSQGEKIKSIWKITKKLWGINNNTYICGVK